MPSFCVLSCTCTCGHVLACMCFLAANTRIYRVMSYDFVRFRTNSYEIVRIRTNSYEFVRACRCIQLCLPACAGRQEPVEEAPGAAGFPTGNGPHTAFRLCLATLPNGLLKGANWQKLPGVDGRLRWLRPQEIVQGTRPTSSDLHV